MDIYFYDFELNCIYVLPASSKAKGYISANAQQDFNGDGSFEIVFYDKELRNIIKNYPDGLIIKWGIFEGLITDRQFKGTQWRIFGIHLNGILHKSVIPGADEELTGNLKTLVRNKINTYFSWLIWTEPEENFPDVTFLRKDYVYGNNYIQDLISRGQAGYRIYIKDKKLCFQLLKSNDNPLMLSTANLNAYDFQEDYNGKNIAYGGWYKQEQPADTDGNNVDPVWTYISADSTKTGLFMQDVILNATTEAEAAEELREYKAEHTLACTTRNISYGTDYRLGDKVRVFNGGICVQKTVMSIKIWHEENTFNEQPILGDYKEALSDNE